MTVHASPALMANESLLWAHIYVTAAGSSPDPASERYDKLRTASLHHRLVKLVKAKKVKARKNLVSGEFKDNVDFADADEQNRALEEGGLVARRELNLQTSPEASRATARRARAEQTSFVDPGGRCRTGRARSR